MDDVVYVNDVNKGETVSYPQGVRNFGDNYIDVIICFSMVFTGLLDQWSCVAVTIPAKTSPNPPRRYQLLVPPGKRST